MHSSLKLSHFEQLLTTLVRSQWFLNLLSNQIIKLRSMLADLFIVVLSLPSWSKWVPTTLVNSQCMFLESSAKPNKLYYVHSSLKLSRFEQVLTTLMRSQWFLNLLSNQGQSDNLAALAWFDRRFKNYWLGTFLGWGGYMNTMWYQRVWNFNLWLISDQISYI